MITRNYYLKNKEINEKDEKELILFCIDEIKNHSDFYSLFSEELEETDEHFIWLNLRCIEKFEEAKGVILKW